MANVTKLHQLRAAAQYQGEGAQRLVDALAVRLYNEEMADGATYYKSNALTNSATVIKSSAGRLYGVIIEGDASTTKSGTGGNGCLQLYNAESVNEPLTVGGVLFMSDVIRFARNMCRAVLFDFGTETAADSTSLYNSGISAAVCTTASGSTAVAQLPTVTIIYA